jgi:tRNA nucleotidyltransferase/poly(A) polymerase
MDEIRELLKVAKEILATQAEKEVERLLRVFLPDTPVSNRAYAVGGYVRDEVIGLPSKDLDIVVEMRDGAKKLSHLLYNNFTGGISRPRQMKNYPIWVISFKEDIEYKGKIYKTKGAEIEIADSQKESFPDEGSRQRVTEYGDIEEDVKRC